MQLRISQTKSYLELIETIYEVILKKPFYQLNDIAINKLARNCFTQIENLGERIKRISKDICRKDPYCSSGEIFRLFKIIPNIMFKRLTKCILEVSSKIPRK
jgi:dihydroneopterin aldolase